MWSVGRLAPGKRGKTGSATQAGTSIAHKQKGSPRRATLKRSAGLTPVPATQRVLLYCYRHRVAPDAGGYNGQLDGSGPTQLRYENNVHLIQSHEGALRTRILYRQEVHAAAACARFDCNGLSEVLEDTPRSQEYVVARIRIADSGANTRGPD